jgi:succinate dehydrogenase/fumarate reductase-like Fe-S protein
MRSTLQGIDEYLKTGEERGQRLNHYKMLKEIVGLVETDFCSEMEMKSLPKSKQYTQKEAQQMANLLGKIYSTAHCIHCYACQTKYLTS